MSPSHNEVPPSTQWKRTLYIIFLAQIVTMIGFSSVFPFLPLYVKSLGAVSSINLETLSGLVFSGQALTMMIASPLWGALADRWGRKLMVERATFGGALILVAMAFVRSAEELVVLRMVQGLITGVVGAANALVAATVPREHTGYAMGLMQVGMGIGIGCGPMIGGTVADAFGYGAAFYITGALLALAGVIVALGVEEQFEAGAPVKGHPERLWVKWRQILSTQAIPVVFSLGFLNQMGRMIYVPVLPLFVLSLLDNPSQVNSFSGVMIGLSSAAAALFSVFLGRMGDRIGHRKIFMVSAVGCALFFFLQSRVSDSMQLMMIHIVTGIALGGIVPSISALLAQFTRPGQEGAVYGLDNSINSAGRAIGPMLGAFIAAMLGLRAVFEATALLYLITAVIALVFLSRSTVRPSRTVKEKD